MDLLLLGLHSSDLQTLAEWFSACADLSVRRFILSSSSRTLADLSNTTTPAVVVRTDGDKLQIAKWIRDTQACPLCLDLRVISLRHPRESSAYCEGKLLRAHCRPWLTEFAREAVSSLLSLIKDSNELDHSGFDINLVTLAVRRFKIEPHSGCPLCAKQVEDTAAGATVNLAPRPKKAVHEYHLSRPKDIAVPLGKCINPTCGMLGSSMVQRRNHDFGAQVVGSFRELGGSRAPISWSGRTYRYRSSLAVGLLEAFERHAGLKMRGKRPTVFDCFSNLRNDALDPRQCGQYQEAFYKGRSDLVPFSEAIKMHWVWGYSLTLRRPVLVPFQMVYYGSQIDRESRFVHETSNGCATGTCIEEAVFFALLEIIERDAFLIHWNARSSPPQIDVGSLRDPQTRVLVERFYRVGLDVFLLDTRLDIGVPSIVAVALRRDKGLGMLALTASCGFDPEGAIASALAELASHEVGFKSRMESKGPSIRNFLSNFAAVQTMDDHGTFYGLPESFDHARFLVECSVKRGLAETYDEWLSKVPRTLDLLDDIQFLLALIEAAGLTQVIVVDQSTPEQLRIGLRTVRVLIPGTVPMDFGYGRCRAASLPRLYTVPVRHGHKKGPILRESLNPAPHPFV